MKLPDRFLHWTVDAKGGKYPCDAQGKAIDPHDPKNWRSYADAAATASGSIRVGWVLNGDGWFFLDLDKCNVGTDWSTDAKMIWSSFPGALGEVSQSGRGLHIIGRCDPSKLEDRRNKWDGWKEFYTDKRFVALNTITGADECADTDHTHMLLQIVPQREFLGELPEGRDPAYTGPEDDDELIAMMLRSGNAASAFGGGVTVKDLWEANAERLATKYPDPERPFDHSAADAAFVSHLAFWTGKDMQRMDRIFRRSGLMRDKYEKRADYRRDTIQNAARLCKAVYDRVRREPKSVEEFIESEGDGNKRQSDFYCAAQLQGKPVQDRRWLVEGLVPSNTVTLLSGDGGTGKSLLALQLAVGVATGTSWLGKTVKHGGAIFMSAEDDNEELQRRLSDVLRAQSLEFRACKKLTLRSLAGEDALLANEGQPSLVPTHLFEELNRRAEKDKPALIVIDTLADVFPANENDRVKVRQFIAILRRLAIQHDCSVLLLSHPSLTGLGNRTGTSGSTAWNNSVRARLYLERIIHDGHEADSSRRILLNKKQNYGAIGNEILMTWQAGVFEANSTGHTSGLLEQQAKAQLVFLKLLRILTEQGRRVNPTSGSNYAPKVFAEHPESEGVTKRALKQAMERLLTLKKIEVKEEGPPSKRTKYLSERVNNQKMPFIDEFQTGSNSPANPLPVTCSSIP